MSKKKKKKKNQTRKGMMKTSFDKKLNETHDDLISEIEEIQRKLLISDQKAIKKQKKKIRKEMGVIPYYTNRERVRAREVAIKEIEEKKILDRSMISLQNLVPTVIILARLIAALILSILSIGPIKRLISPSTLQKMDTVYKVAMSIG